MNRKTFIRSLAALGISLGVSLPPAVHAQTTLTMSSWVPPTHFLAKDVFEPWIAEVNKVTEGRVSIRVLPKPVGAPAQHWELARKGVADITWGNFTYEPDRFKTMWFAEVPMMGSHCASTSVALWRTYQKYLASHEAFKGVQMLAMGMLAGGQINHGSKPMATPEDFKGQKIRMGGPIQKRLLEDMGAVPVSAPAPKAYEMLEGGVIDASLHGLESVVNFRLDGKLKFHTVIPEGFYDATFFIGINEGKWQQISQKDRDAIMAISGEVLSRKWGQQFDIQSKSAEEKLRAAGHTFTMPSKELLQRIGQIRQTMLNEWIAEAPSFGLKDAKGMLGFYEASYKELRK